MVTWLVRYFRLRADVREVARRLQGARDLLGPDTLMTLRDLAMVGRALEELVDGRGGPDAVPGARHLAANGLPTGGPREMPPEGAPEQVRTEGPTGAGPTRGHKK